MGEGLYLLGKGAILVEAAVFLKDLLNTSEGTELQHLTCTGN